MSSKNRDNNLLIPEEVFIYLRGIGYTVEVLKNERISTPIQKLTPPERGTEIVVTQIPSHLLEDYLFPYFQQAGLIYKFRIVLINPWVNNGTVFITYCIKQAADNCIDLFDCKPIPTTNNFIFVERVPHNKRLFIGGILDTKTKDEVWHEIIKIGMKGVADMIMYKSYTDKSKNRGFVFVEFNSYEEAAIAKRIYENSVLFGQKVVVDWPSPPISLSDEINRKVTVIFIRNLNEEQPRDEFINFLWNTLQSTETVEKVYKYANYAFVRFKTRRDAQKGMWELKNYYKKMNTDIIVGWAKPPANSPVSNINKENSTPNAKSQDYKTFSLPACDCICKHSDDPNGAIENFLKPQNSVNHSDNSEHSYFSSPLSTSKSLVSTDFQMPAQFNYWSPIPTNNGLLDTQRAFNHSSPISSNRWCGSSGTQSVFIHSSPISSNNLSASSVSHSPSQLNPSRLFTTNEQSGSLVSHSPPQFNPSSSFTTDESSSSLVSQSQPLFNSLVWNSHATNAPSGFSFDIKILPEFYHLNQLLNESSTLSDFQIPPDLYHSSQLFNQSSTSSDFQYPPEFYYTSELLKQASASSDKIPPEFYESSLLLKESCTSSDLQSSDEFYHSSTLFRNEASTSSDIPSPPRSNNPKTDFLGQVNNLLECNLNSNLPSSPQSAESLLSQLSSLSLFSDEIWSPSFNDSFNADKTSN